MAPLFFFAKNPVRFKGFVESTNKYKWEKESERVCIRNAVDVTKRDNWFPDIRSTLFCPWRTIDERILETSAINVESNKWVVH